MLAFSFKFLKPQNISKIQPYIIYWNTVIKIEYEKLLKSFSFYIFLTKFLLVSLWYNYYLPDWIQEKCLFSIVGQWHLNFNYSILYRNINTKKCIFKYNSHFNKDKFTLNHNVELSRDGLDFILIPGRRNLVDKEWTRFIFLYLAEETLLSRVGLDVCSYTW